MNKEDSQLGKYFKEYWWVLIVVLILISVSYDFNQNYQFTAKDILTFLVTPVVTFVIAIVTLKLFGKRVKNQEKQVDQQREQIDLQIEQRVDERFTTAISLLGSNESSARTGAIYALYHLAIDDKKYRRQIGLILCSHIRSKTNEKEYPTDHKKRPSNEIQTCIDLLFKEDKLYDEYRAELDNANLRHAYLVGADFYDAKCQGADFYDAKCQGASFKYAQCQGAGFRYAELQCAKFIGARCQGANFNKAKCQGAKFFHAKCQGTDFINTQCQGANFSGANCQGAGFINARCQGANFDDAKLQGAKFWNAQCQGAGFSHTQCKDVDFGDTQMQGAYALDGWDYISLQKRVGKDTDLQTMVFAGEIDATKDLLDDEENEGKKKDFAVPKGIITGVLKDSDEIQKIIREIDEVRKN